MGTVGGFVAATLLGPAGLAGAALGVIGGNLKADEAIEQLRRAYLIAELDLRYYYYSKLYVADESLQVRPLFVLN